MEKKSFEELIKDVFGFTLDLVRGTCSRYSHRYNETNCTSDDHGDCYLKRFLEWYEEAIESMDLDSITKDKLKDYFLHGQILYFNRRKSKYEFFSFFFFE